MTQGWVNACVLKLLKCLYFNKTEELFGGTNWSMFIYWNIQSKQQKKKITH